MARPSPDVVVVRRVKPHSSRKQCSFAIETLSSERCGLFRANIYHFRSPSAFPGVQEVCETTGPDESPLTEQPCSGYNLKAQPEERYEGDKFKALGNIITRTTQYEHYWVRGIESEHIEARGGTANATGNEKNSGSDASTFLRFVPHLRSERSRVPIGCCIAHRCRKRSALDTDMYQPESVFVERRIP